MFDFIISIVMSLFSLFLVVNNFINLCLFEWIWWSVNWKSTCWNLQCAIRNDIITLYLCVCTCTDRSRPCTQLTPFDRCYRFSTSTKIYLLLSLWLCVVSHSHRSNLNAKFQFCVSWMRVFRRNLYNLAIFMFVFLSIRISFRCSVLIAKISI